MNNISLTLQRTILIIGIVLMSLKFVAWYITGSNALLTDALESIVNVLAGAFTLYSLHLAVKPMDKDHPYGHGKIEYIAAGIEGALIGLAGLFMIIKAANDFESSAPLEKMDIGIAIAATAGALNYIMGNLLVRKGRSTRSIAMVAGGKHLQSDGYTSAGMVVGLIVLYITEIAWIDNLIAILLGLLLSYTCVSIIRKSISGIMDETDMEVVEEIVEVFRKNRVPNWIDIHNLRVIRYGGALHIDCHVTLPWYMDLRQAHEEMDRIQQVVEAELKTKTEFFIHNDPCLVSSCSICTITDCKERKMAFEKKIEWDLDNVLANSKHGIK